MFQLLSDSVSPTPSYLWVSIYEYLSIYLSIYVCMYVCIYLSSYLSIYLRTYVRMYVCIIIYAYLLFVLSYRYMLAGAFEKAIITVFCVYVSAIWEIPCNESSRQ